MHIINLIQPHLSLPLGQLPSGMKYNTQIRDTMCWWERVHGAPLDGCVGAWSYIVHSYLVCLYAVIMSFAWSGLKNTMVLGAEFPKWFWWMMTYKYTNLKCTYTPYIFHSGWDVKHTATDDREFITKVQHARTEQSHMWNASKNEHYFIKFFLLFFCNFMRNGNSRWEKNQ